FVVGHGAFSLGLVWSGEAGPWREGFPGRVVETEVNFRFVEDGPATCIAAPVTRSEGACLPLSPQ
ncbi:MAG: hypothetical protein KDI47_18140, partial [Gammaproteobacteria bacterium]|nr:hypothetical protein [Gammaproteobacteria bacterium]